MHLGNWEASCVAKYVWAEAPRGLDQKPHQTQATHRGRFSDGSCRRGQSNRRRDNNLHTFASPLLICGAIRLFRRNPSSPRGSLLPKWPPHFLLNCPTQRYDGDGRTARLLILDRCKNLLIISPRRILSSQKWSAYILFKAQHYRVKRRRYSPGLFLRNYVRLVPRVAL